MSVAASKNPLYAQVHKILLDRISQANGSPASGFPTRPCSHARRASRSEPCATPWRCLLPKNVLVRREGVGTFVSTYRTGGYWNRFQPFDTVEASERYDVRRFGAP